MSVVTEGVETQLQMENLISLGDNFAQGYYFYKPMPKEAFEELIRNPDMVTSGYEKDRISASSQLHFREMIKKGLVSETLLNNIIRAAATCRLQDEKISIVQINSACSALTGIPASEEAMQNFEAHLKEPQKEHFRKLLKQADSHALGGSEGCIDFQKNTGETITLNMRVFLLYACDDHRIYLATMR